MSTAEPAQPTLTPAAPPTPTPHNPAAPDSPTIGPGYDEQVNEIVDRLRQRYSREEITPADLEGRVRGFYRRFETARVRTYVAVFVERLVRHSIDDPSPSKPATPTT
jgi:hypothetical protein